MAKSEQHPNFPSGEWEGHYLWQAGAGAERHPMDFILNFKEGIVTGSGSDDVGSFKWEGEYSTSSMSVKMVKVYRTHLVLYSGMADTNGIYGSWEIPPFGRGGFHVWPKKNKGGTSKKEVKTKKKVKNKKLSAV
jgi:hypothetical protein